MLSDLDAPRRPDAVPVNGPVDWDPLLQRALRGDGVAMVYQPIVDLDRLVLAGYEALVRFAGPSHLTPDRWFAAAAARGVLADLEAVTLGMALTGRGDLPSDCFLTVNLEPESLLSPKVGGLLARVGDLRGIVVEVTDRPIVDRPATERVLDALRRAGALIAVDDAGTGYAELQQTLALRPSIIKIDRGLVEGADREPARAALIEMLGVFADSIDASLLAEGVETPGEARRLMDLGVPLAQGYLFGRPAAPWAELNAAASDPLRAQSSSGRTETLHPLVEAAGCVSAREVATAAHRLRLGTAPMLAVLDDERRPVGLLTPDAVRRAETPSPLIANIDSSIREVAHRLATRRPADTSTPVLVTDHAGRYVGVVTVPRLLAALADC